MAQDTVKIPNLPGEDVRNADIRCTRMEIRRAAWRILTLGRNVGVFAVGVERSGRGPAKSARSDGLSEHVFVQGDVQIAQ